MIFHRPFLYQHFNSRPHGGRPSYWMWKDGSLCISTHALTEGDVSPFNSSGSPNYFNSRPHGGRLSRWTVTVLLWIFQLTPSRRATYVVRFCGAGPYISTHALTEGDSLTIQLPEPHIYFNSRPHGGRQQI